MIVFMYIRQREPAKIVSKEWKLTIVFLRGLNVVSPDGNGRTGRLILFKECLKNDIIPFVVNDSRKAEYYHALNTAQTKQDYSLLERFFREEQSEYRQQVEGFLPPVKE